MSKYGDFEYIITITNLNEVVNNCMTHFHFICVNNNNLEVIKYCVEHGADLNIKDIFKSNSFHFICLENPTKEVLEYCLENGADLNIENKYGNTPFHLICKNNNKDLIHICKPYMKEYDYIKMLKENNLNWKEY